MLEKVKKYAIIAVIAILFTLFSFSIVDMAREKPDYLDFCTERPMPVPKPLMERNVSNCPTPLEPTSTQIEECRAQGGNIDYDYDSNGCASGFACNTCYAKLEEAMKGHRLLGFIITSIMAVLAIIAGLYISSKNEVVESVFSGILIGGIITLFVGTMSYFNDMGRFIKPFIILAEIGIIIWIALKTAKKRK